MDFRTEGCKRTELLRLVSTGLVEPSSSSSFKSKRAELKALKLVSFIEARSLNKSAGFKLEF